MFQSPNKLPILIPLVIFVLSKVCALQGASFSLIDTNAWQTIGTLNDKISYYNIRSSTHLLNIRYDVQEMDNIEPLSVLLTLENGPAAPKIVYCDSKAPYRIFEHPNGTAYGNIIQVGRGVITATPYSGTNCTGSIIGPTTTQIFQVTGCRYDLTTTKIRTGRRYFIITQNVTIPSHTCRTSTMRTFQTTIRARHVYCGFPRLKFQLELYNRTKSGRFQLVHDITVPELPLFLFGFAEVRGEPLPSGNIRPGSYSTRLIVNDIASPFINFTIKDQCFEDFDAS